MPRESCQVFYDRFEISAGRTMHCQFVSFCPTLGKSANGSFLQASQLCHKRWREPMDEPLSVIFHQDVLEFVH
ncbi:MAG TPA: hypothetical protein VI282_05770 [Verrucomicrobiae bacterium]